MSSSFSGPEKTAGGESLRFRYGYTLVLFAEDWLIVLGTISNRWILVLTGLLTGAAVSFLPNLVHIQWLGGALFLFFLVSDVGVRLARWLQRRSWSKLSDAELAEKALRKKNSRIPWSEIHEVNLHDSSLSVSWDGGLKKKVLILKFDHAKFEKIREFLSPKLGGRLAAVKDLNSYIEQRAAESLGVIQQQPFQSPVKRFVLFGSAGAAGLFLSGYLLSFYVFNGSYFQSHTFFPVGVCVSTIAGFLLCLFSMSFLRTSILELRRIDTVRFSRLLWLVYVQLGLVAATALFSIPRMFTLPSWVWPLLFIGEIIAIYGAVIVMGIFSVKFVRRIGPLYNKGAIIFAMVLLASSMVFFLVAPIFPITSSAAPSSGANQPITIVNVTTINLDIQYENAAAKNWIGPSHNSSGGATAVYGGRIFNETVKCNPIGVLPHNIIKISVPTAGFSLVSTNPSPPFSEDSYNSFNVTVSIRAPNQNYTGPVEVNIYVA